MTMRDVETVNAEVVIDADTETVYADFGPFSSTDTAFSWADGVAFVVPLPDGAQSSAVHRDHPAGAAHVWIGPFATKEQAADWITTLLTTLEERQG